MTPTALLSRLAGRRVAIVGDVMLDHFLVGSVDRISPEAPVPVVRFEREEYRLGGAANVAHNVVALGGQATLIGLVGDDEAAQPLKAAVARVGIGGADLIVDRHRPTTRKVRVVTGRNQQVARIDYESDREAAGTIEARLIDRVTAAAGGHDALVISDYRKGVVTPGVVEAAARGAHAAGIPLLVDPKVPDASRYRGATLVTPNHHEAELMTQRPIRSVEDARAAAATLAERTGASVLMTWGEHGMFVHDRRSSQVVETALPAAAREVSDVTGAGDTVIAVLALGLAAGASLTDAARLATLAAGLVVARFGPAAPSAAELAAAVVGARD